MNQAAHCRVLLPLVVVAHREDFDVVGLSGKTIVVGVQPHVGDEQQHLLRRRLHQQPVRHTLDELQGGGWVHTDVRGGVKKMGGKGV